MSFAELGLSDALLKAVADSGYDEPTPIQRQAIGPVLMGRDIIGVAQTGTGKTASFVLPMIDVLAEGRSRARMPRSLILEPTRELAQQVSENFDKYGKYHKLSMALLIGGVSMGDQLATLEKGVDVLIATPGRLMDLFGRGKIMLNQCSLLVIDEADRMLDMGFIPDIEEICTKLPTPRQTLLFSATMPPPIKKLADRFMTDPKMIEVARPASTNVSITQWVVKMEPRAKRETLRQLLATDEVKNAIVFCNRKRDIKELVENLKRAGFRVSQIHGDMEQADRIRELDRFKSGDITIIVASDVAARGLDIPGVSHVVNYDVPHHAEDYVHRIGRTGRAGRTGTAFTLMTADEAENLADVEKLIGQKVPVWGQPQPAAAAKAAEKPIEKAEPSPAPAAAKPKPAEAAALPASEPVPASDPPRKPRRRGGRGGRGGSNSGGGRSENDRSRTEPGPQDPPAAAREPSRASQPDDRPREARSDRRDDRRDDRQSSQRDGRRDDRRARDGDDDERVAGFGAEGIPEFLRHKATIG